MRQEDFDALKAKAKERMTMTDKTSEAAGKPTPGPWLASGHRVHTPVDTLDTCVAVCAGDAFDASSYDECLANARFIAAAPEMAAERDRLRKACEAVERAFATGERSDGWGSDMDTAAELVRAALAGTSPNHPPDAGIVRPNWITRCRFHDVEAPRGQCPECGCLECGNCHDNDCCPVCGGTCNLTEGCGHGCKRRAGDVEAALVAALCASRDAAHLRHSRRATAETCLMASCAGARAVLALIEKVK